MNFRHAQRQYILLIVDSFILCFSLIIAFSFRIGEIKTIQEFFALFPAFSPIIISSLVVFHIYGLYDKPTLKLTKELTSRIITSQILSALLAALLFYNIPSLGVAPKTILILYILASSVISIIWRKYAYHIILRRKQQKAVLIGSGDSFALLCDEFTRNPHLGIVVMSLIDLDVYNTKDIMHAYDKVSADIIIVDLRDQRLQTHLGALYNQLFKDVAVLDMVDVYRDVFEAVPLDLINQEWLLRHIDISRRYDSVKRVIDSMLTLPFFLLSLFVYPFIYIAIKAEDGGPLLYSHKRIGRHGKSFLFYKIRSMEHKPSNELKETKKVTKVGAFLRKSRLDEIPQLFNVLRGDLSLVGPRPEVPVLVDEYNKAIKYYPMRHLIRPGVTGLAQIKQSGNEVPRFGLDTSQTQTKLSYDLHYIASGTLLYDVSIILKTIKVMLSKAGM